MTGFYRRTVKLGIAVVAVVALLSTPKPSAAYCEPVICPDWMEWSWEDCGCVCTSEICCQVYGTC